MKAVTAIMVGVLFASFGTRVLPAQDATSQTEVIPIAVLNMQSTGGLEEEEVNTLNFYLRDSISGLPNYQVIEQEDIDEVLRQFEQQQLSGLYEIDTERLQLTAAEQITIGTVGKLFDRIVISLRLVEISTGEVLFSYTVHSSEDNVYSRLDEIVQRVREYGQLRGRTITLEDIENMVDRRNPSYTEAQVRLEQFLQQNRRLEREGSHVPEFDAERLAELQREISENLFDDYLDQANRARRREDFAEARRMITRAIAIQPTSEALELRDRIHIEQDAYERERETRRRMIELRAAEEQEQELSRAYLSPLDSIRLYYEEIEPTALRLSASTMMYVPYDLELPEAPGSVGVQYYHTFSLSGTPIDPAYFQLRSVAAVSALLDYDTTLDENMLSLHTTVSPHTGFVVKLFHLVTTIGIDGGLLIQYGPAVANQYSLHPTLGASTTVDFMLTRSRGVHIGARLDHAFQYDNRDDLFPEGLSSPWLARIFAGISL